MSNLTVQVDLIKLNVIDVALWGSYLLCQLVCATVTILFINLVLGLIAIILCLPLSISPILSKKAVERARNLLVHSTNDLNESSSDLLHGLVDRTTQGAERSVDQRYSQANEKWIHAANHDARVRKRVDAINDLLSHILNFWGLDRWRNPHTEIADVDSSNRRLRFADGQHLGSPLLRLRPVLPIQCGA